MTDVYRAEFTHIIVSTREREKKFITDTRERERERGHQLNYKSRAEQNRAELNGRAECDSL